MKPLIFDNVSPPNFLDEETVEVWCSRMEVCQNNFEAIYGLEEGLNKEIDGLERQKNLYTEPDKAEKTKKLFLELLRDVQEMLNLILEQHQCLTNLIPENSWQDLLKFDPLQLKIMVIMESVHSRIHSFPHTVLLLRKDANI